MVHHYFGHSITVQGGLHGGCRSKYLRTIGMRTCINKGVEAGGDNGSGEVNEREQEEGIREERMQQAPSTHSERLRPAMVRLSHKVGSG